jgi:probable HAF family extracellular repeat protein
MSQAFSSRDSSRSFSLKLRIDQVCDRFELAWQAGPRPRIDDYLSDTPEPERSLLLRELIALDIDYRRQAGEQPQPEDYRVWLPSLDLTDFAGKRPQDPNQQPRLPAPAPRVPSDSAPSETSTLSRSDGTGSAERGFLEPGTVIDQCRIDSLLGHGGMGEVYLAEHTVLRKKVAVKVLPAHRVGDTEAVRRFQQEVRMQARMNPHPNVAAAFHASEYQGRCYLVMEYVPGINLHEHVRREGPLGWEQACALVRQIAVGLDYVHKHEIVHRDLKPSNLLLTPDGTVKILDLGLASHRPAEVLLPDGSLTPDGLVLGSLDYLAPEQARSAAQADARSDLYSLGCTFYYLLTGKAPFADRAGLDKITAHARDVPPSLRQQRPDVPEAVAGIVEKLLAKKPEDRYASAHDLIAALDNAVTAMPAPSGADAPVPPLGKRVHRAADPVTRTDPATLVATPAVPPRRFRMPLLAACGIGGIVLGVMLWRPWVITPPSPERPGENAATIAELPSPVVEKYTYTTLDVPASTSTYALGINDSGQVVGGFINAAGTHGFLLDHGVYTTIDVHGSTKDLAVLGASTAGLLGSPGGQGPFLAATKLFPGTASTRTQANGINGSGQIVGYYSVSEGPFHGFLFKKGNITTFDVPGSNWTKANGTNRPGQIVGEYSPGGTGHGFLFDHGIFIRIDVPGSGYTGARDINASGQIVGFYGVGGTCHGFLLSGGSYTPLDVPGSSSTSALGITHTGQVVGGYKAGGTDHGFLLNHGTYTTIDPLGSIKTEAFGINASGQIVGMFSDAGGVHGFLATPLR